MPTVNLNDRFVASVRSKTRENFFDTKVKGLTLRVSPTGTKSWHFVYRVAGKPSQWLTIGSYPATPLVDARKLALDQRRAVDVEGRDPIADQRAAAAAKIVADREAQQRAADEASKTFTFDDLAKLYLTFAKAKKKSWNDDRQKIDKYLRPAWGPRSVRDIRRADINDLLDRLTANGMTVGVNRVKALISFMFTFALDRDKIDAHPAAKMLRRFKERPRERVLSDDELRKLLAGVDAQPSAAADALRLRLLLGQRGEETCGMLFDEVDFDEAIWAMPGGRTKSGQPHRVPLSPTALQIVRDRRAIVPADEPCVFPGVSLRSDDYRALATIHQGAYQFKDLRRTVATRLADLGFDDTIIGRTLNHAKYTITAKHYNLHQYDDEKRRALTAWDTELQRIRDRKPKSSRVVPFGKGA